MSEAQKWTSLSAMTALIVVLSSIAGAFEVRAEETPDHRVYLKYCSACHGPTAQGDGVVSQLMRPKPTDLTQIAKRHGGEFPTLTVIQVIDGRKSVRAHGDPDMPVWGELLRAPVGGVVGAEPPARGTVMQITEYLRSVQAK